VAWISSGLLITGAFAWSVVHLKSMFSQTMYYGCEVKVTNVKVIHLLLEPHFMDEHSGLGNELVLREDSVDTHEKLPEAIAFVTASN